MRVCRVYVRQARPGIASFKDDAAPPHEAFVYHAAGLGGEGSSSYIDSVILRDREPLEVIGSISSRDLVVDLDPETLL